MRHGAPEGATILVTAAILASVGCRREEREFHGSAPGASTTVPVRLSPLQPGEKIPHVLVHNDYDDNAYALSEGKALYTSFNCVGCHAHGGGGMGPPLMDNKWIYGSEPQQIFATIVQGRPNGMPSFGGKITDDQVWKLVAYVRSLSGLVPKNAAPGRNDEMKTKSPENSTPTKPPTNSPGVPPSGEMPQ